MSAEWLPQGEEVNYEHFRKCAGYSEASALCRGSSLGSMELCQFSQMFLKSSSLIQSLLHSTLGHFSSFSWPCWKKISLWDACVSQRLVEREEDKLNKNHVLPLVCSAEWYCWIVEMESSNKTFNWKEGWCWGAVRMGQSSPGCWGCCPATCDGICPISTGKDSGVTSGEHLELKEFGDHLLSRWGLHCSSWDMIFLPVWVLTISIC